MIFLTSQQGGHKVLHGVEAIVVSRYDHVILSVIVVAF